MSDGDTGLIFVFSVCDKRRSLRLLLTMLVKVNYLLKTQSLHCKLRVVKCGCLKGAFQPIVLKYHHM